MPASKDLSGLIVPVISPVDENDNIDEPAFRRVLRHLIAAGVDAVFVGGSAGEGPLLAPSPWSRLMEIAFDEGAGKVHLLGGVSDTSTRKVTEKIEVLAGIGYRYFVLTPTFYQPIPTSEEQLRLFGECKAAGGEMEMIAYNIPPFTASVISIDTICEMARRGWTRYYKESSADMTYFWRLMERAPSVGLNVFMGDERFIADGLMAGACGIVPVCANYEPRTFVRACQAAKRGDANELMRLQKRIVYIRERLVLGSSCWLAGLKYAMSKLGMGSGKPVSPLQPASAEQKQAIDHLSPFE